MIATAGSPASAHVAISPDTAASGQFATYTFTVPNERDDQDTVGLDITLPAGFQLETAESLSGWQTVVDNRPDGTASAVHWGHGRIPPHTFGRFALRGRTGDEPGVLSFASVQHYERDTEAWTGSAESEHPAPILTVRAGSPDAPVAASGVPQVPPAGPASGAEVGADPLARSRAGLALVLALAALLVLAGMTGNVMLRRRAHDRARPTKA
jgi:uncharacterized protein YcnI